MFAVLLAVAQSLIPIPKGQPGIHFGPATALINVELFVDAVCPDCATIWPIVEQVLAKYPTVNVQVHWLDLPTHTWAFAVSRAAFAAKSISEELAQKVVTGLFGNHEQDQFGTSKLMNVPESQVIPMILRWVSDTYNVDYSQIEMAYESVDVQMATRIDYKYSYIRNLPGTPTVYVNGAQTTLNEGSTFDDWCTLIDSLL